MPAIAKAVGLDFSGPPGPSAQLINYPHNRSILLWLGNLEHLLDGIEWLTGMLASLPGLKLHLPIGARAAAGDRVGVGAKVHAVLSQCVERARVLGDLDVLRFALRYEGRVHTLRGRLEAAEACLRESLELSRVAGQLWEVAITGGYLGRVAYDRAALDVAAG